MELRTFAAGIIEATTLAGKLEPPPGDFTDREPGLPTRYAEPVRPPLLDILPGGDVRVPPPEGMHDPVQRARILHALANHELQAAEIFAWAVLAFPAAPAAFRRGCAAIIADEQRHCRLYTGRLESLGLRFGDLPVSGHFWRKVEDIHTPLEFVCTMGLTFENANLDFSVEHIVAAREAGDEETARVLEQVHDDEVRHVGFAWRWMRSFKDPQTSDWDAFVSGVRPPHGPSRARGRTFDRDARVAAGMDEEFIARLAAERPTAPGGAPRG